MGRSSNTKQDGNESNPSTNQVSSNPPTEENKGLKSSEKSFFMGIAKPSMPTALPVSASKPVPLSEEHVETEESKKKQKKKKKKNPLIAFSMCQVLDTMDDEKSPEASKPDVESKPEDHSKGDIENIQVVEKGNAEMETVNSSIANLEKEKESKNWDGMGWDQAEIES